MELRALLWLLLAHMALQQVRATHAPDRKPAESKPQVLAFYMESTNTPDYWLDYDWDILTHIVTYGANKANMVTYAKARGVKLLQAFSGCEYVATGNATVRAAAVGHAR
jgi:hypothetical protein